MPTRDFLFLFMGISLFLPHTQKKYFEYTKTKKNHLTVPELICF